MAAEVEVDRPIEGVPVLSMDNGPRNFSTATLHERLEAALTAKRDDGIRMVILASGLDGFFVSHGDIVETLMGRQEPSGDPSAYLRVQRELDKGPNDLDREACLDIGKALVMPPGKGSMTRLSCSENNATQWLLPSSARAAERYLSLASPR